MKIAVTSQNRREITRHAGKCSKFWIYEVSDGKIGEKTYGGYYENFQRIHQ